MFLGRHVCIGGRKGVVLHPVCVISWEGLFLRLFFFLIMWGSRCVHLSPGVLRAEWHWTFL